MNEQVAVEVLKEVKETLDEHKIEFWIDCGTLLGAARNGKFIPWDNDIDLGAWRKDLDEIKKACNDLVKKDFVVPYKEKMGLIVPSGITKKDCMVGIRVFDLNEEGNHVYTYMIPIHIVGRFLDSLLWVLKLRGGKTKKDYGSKLPVNFIDTLVKICNAIPSEIRKKLVDIVQTIYNKIDSIHFIAVVPGHYFKDLVDMDFYGMKIKVPRDTDGYLTYRYGEEWRNPQKKYVSGAVVRKYRYGGKDMNTHHVWDFDKDG